MSNLQMTTFYLTVGRSYSEIPNGFTLPISTYVGQAIYAVVSLNQQLAVVVDINKAINLAPPVAASTTYGDLLTSYITQNNIQNITVPYFPKVNSQTGRYDHRIEVIDPRAEAGWSIDFGSAYLPSIVSNLQLTGALDDIILTPPTGTNLNNLLVSINGVLHATTIVNEKLYVIDGFASMRQSAIEDICVLDTTSIGGHTILPITSDMILSDPSTFGQQLYLKTKTTSLIGKSVLLSMDGYLQIFGNSYDVRDDNTIYVRTSLIDYIGNFIYSPFIRSYKDALSVRNKTNPYDPDNTQGQTLPDPGIDRMDSTLYAFVGNPTTPVSTFNTQAFMIERFTSKHSFIIVLNNPYVFTQKFTFSNLGEPTMYETFANETPRGIPLYGRGYVIPFTILFNHDDPQRLLYLERLDNRSGLYTTGMNNPSYPAPWADWKDPNYRPAFRLLDVFSGTDMSS